MSVYISIHVDVYRYNSLLRVNIEISEKKPSITILGRQHIRHQALKTPGGIIRLYCPERKCGLSLAHPIWQLSRQRVILSDRQPTVRIPVSLLYNCSRTELGK